MIVFIVQVFMLGVFVEHWSTHAQEHIGCFHRTDLQPLLEKVTLIKGLDENTMTIDICIVRCKTLSTTYAGITIGYTCRCGNNQEHEANKPQLNDSSCTTTCPGDNRRECGGDDSMVIYSVCDQNRYHKVTNGEGNCDASCHCIDRHTCAYSTGLCPAGCELGWSSAVCNVKNLTFVAGAQTLMTDPVDHSASTAMTVHPTITLVSASRADADGRIDSHTDDNIPVTAIAVGVSVAFICLVAFAALFVFFRKRGHTRKSDDSPIVTASIPEVIVDGISNKDDLAMVQPVNGQPSSLSPALNHSPVIFANHSPTRDDGKDIGKSDDDIGIHDDQEKVEYAVSMRPAVTQHANLKENSLYGTCSEDTDDNNFEWDNSYKE